MDRTTDRLLVIDDDVELCELVTEYLEPEGFQVESVLRGEQGVERALSGEHALVIVDVMLPGMNGLDVLRRIRSKSVVPVLMLTARGDDVDRIVGLELGADDYLPKPFNPRELVARIRAILRRAGESVGNGGPGRMERLRVGDVELDVGARVVRQDGKVVDLTTAEFGLLETLLRSAGAVVPRTDLFEAALDRELTPLDRSVDMHVSNLRKKLGAKCGDVERIKAVRGVGYVYTIPSTSTHSR
ncbi:MAG: response regulator transcription factor [Phycisphaerae bacterium]|nr:response regulator transcription factor [Phycisphaerae bacterium]